MEKLNKHIKVSVMGMFQAPKSTNKKIYNPIQSKLKENIDLIV